MTIGAALTDEERREVAAGAVSLVPGEETPQFFLTCEHASCLIPAQWNDLGLSRAELHDHIGWDIGAARITRLLAEKLKAPAVLSGYSRLFVECNRLPDAPDFVAPTSAGILIPGNQNVDPIEIMWRKKLGFDSFHETVATCLDRYRRALVYPVIISIHTFAPRLGAEIRPWNVGVLWKKDATFARLVQNRLEKAYDGRVGFNEPYDGNLVATATLEYHILPRNLRHVIFEIRNDLVQDEAGCSEWAERLAACLSLSTFATMRESETCNRPPVR